MTFIIWETTTPTLTCIPKDFYPAIVFVWVEIKLEIFFSATKVSIYMRT